VIIVTYHAVASPASPVCCPPDQLRADIQGLTDAGFTFVSLDDCAAWLEGGPPIPSRAVAVTFDDAYASVVTDALPVLARLSIPTTVFAIGARIGGDNRWSGQWSSIPTMPLADASQLRELVRAGIAIGSHSWSHPVLPTLPPAALRGEIEESADRLEQMLGTTVRHFAYPYGMRGAREVAAARPRYRTAVNAEPRLVSRGADPHDLCRIDCHDLRMAVRMNLFEPAQLGPYLATRRGLRQVRRVLDGVLGKGPA
jgi:peptidoglycan/xylan/chitin deacetylase (PgdA/CDA1 family)